VVGRSVALVAIIRFKNSYDRPVLMSPANEMFRPEDYDPGHLPSDQTKQWLPQSVKQWFSPSVNLPRFDAIKRLVGLLAESGKGKPCVLFVGSGSQRGWLEELLGDANILYSDINVRVDVDLFCDGHD